VRAQQAVRDSAVGQDPTVQSYLDLIDRQEASPYQLAAFGNFVAESGMPGIAEVYYSVALSMEQEDPLLWTNLGTLHRQQGELSNAVSAYSRALKLNPNHAMAHYNMASVLDEQGRYEDAIEAYTVALTLDPSLGDPATNPQAANNPRLLEVKLLLYRQRIGSLGTPLIEVPSGHLVTDPDPELDDPDD
jgi:tetratricopeptide (TPR) repeat protein